MYQKNFPVCLVFLLLFVFGCSTKHSTDYQPAGDQIRIGALLPITGDGYSSGQAIKVSLDLAVEDAGDYLESAGRKEEILVEYADTRTDTAEALRQIELFYSKGIRFVIGPCSSSELLAVRSFADSHGMLLVSPSSVASSLAIPGDNIFRMVSSDHVQALALNKMLTEDKIKVLVPFILDDADGNELLDATRGLFMKNGGAVLNAVTYRPGTSDFTSLLDTLNKNVKDELDHHNPNEVGVYLLSTAEGASVLASAKHFAYLNLVYWYGGSLFAQNSAALGDTAAALFSYTHGLPCPVYGLDDDARDKWQLLQDRIRAVIGRIPDIYSLTAYDALWLAVLTYTTAGANKDIMVLKTTFSRVSENYFGVTGNTRFDENGDRAYGNYDFWAVKTDTAGYCWKRVARYNLAAGTLVRTID